MKAAHYLLALATLIVGVLIGMNMKKSPKLDEIPPGSSELSEEEIRTGMNAWYNALDSVPAYFVMDKKNMKTMKHILDEFQDKYQVVVSIQNFGDAQQVLMSSFSEDGAFEKAYSINDPIIRCPTICDLHLIETLRPINSDTDTNPEEENPQEEPMPDVPREEEDKPKK